MREKLIYTNTLGESVTLCHRPPFLLSKIDGLGDVDGQVQLSKSPAQDGAMHIDTLLEPRYLSLQVSILADSRADVSMLRSRLSSVFNPKYSGTIFYENAHGKWQIPAVSEHVPKYPSDGRMMRSQIALVNLTCPSPYWQDINPTNVKLEDYVANFHFPFSFPVSFAVRGDQRTLINSGHVSTPVRITFRGEAVNPKITKIDTGEFIRIKRTISAGYALVISTDTNNKSVRIVSPDGLEQNAMPYIDLDSTFFSLDVGENKISFLTDGGQPEVYIEYRNLFLGV